MAQPTIASPQLPAGAATRPAPIRSVQPGGGVCYSIELACGRVRRWYLKRFRKQYVARMATRRIGDTLGAPHEVLDPRDLKFCRNQCTADWATADDPFAWRERIPLARWGLAEVQLMGWPLAAAAVALAAWGWWIAALVPAVLCGFLLWFFRDPPRRVPSAAGAVVAPADGRVAAITRLEYDEFCGGPAIRIDIFLSIFNVHINRSPLAARVVAIEYRPGKFLNAMRARSATENEALWIGLEQTQAPYRKLSVTQVAGLYARRIVCALRLNEQIARGAKFGMIKLGSRTVLILPEEAGLALEVREGSRVKAGQTIMARYDDPPGAEVTPT
jgi:phosphatidylserine decarboxylase